MRLTWDLSPTTLQLTMVAVAISPSFGKPTGVPILANAGWKSKAFGEAMILTGVTMAVSKSYWPGIISVGYLLFDNWTYQQPEPSALNNYNLPENS